MGLDSESNFTRKVLDYPYHQHQDMKILRLDNTVEDSEEKVQFSDQKQQTRSFEP